MLPKRSRKETVLCAGKMSIEPIVGEAEVGVQHPVRVRMLTRRHPHGAASTLLCTVPNLLTWFLPLPDMLPGISPPGYKTLRLQPFGMVS